MGTDNTRNRPHYRDAINAKCVDCCYWPDNGGTWRQQVGDCNIVTCPLWPIRPLPMGRGANRNGPATVAILAKRRGLTDEDPDT